MTDAITEMATAHLRAEEGVRKAAYQDHLGWWTIGAGRLIDARKGGGLSDDEIDYLLANDIAKVQRQMAGWPAWEKVKADPVRATALSHHHHVGHRSPVRLGVLAVGRASRATGRAGRSRGRDHGGSEPGHRSHGSGGREPGGAG